MKSTNLLTIVSNFQPDIPVAIWSNQIIAASRDLTEGKIFYFREIQVSEIL